MALGSTQPINRNEYQKYCPGVKAARCLGLITLQLHAPNILKSESLKLLETSGTPHAYRGIAFTFFTENVL